MERDPEARRLERRERRDRRLEPGLPDTPWEGYYRLSSRAGRISPGSPLADRIMRMAFGFATGLALTAQIVLGMPEEGLKFSRDGIVNVPLIQFGFVGFTLGLVLSPIGLLATRRLQRPKYLLRGGFVAGVIAGLILAVLPF